MPPPWASTLRGSPRAKPRYFAGGICRPGGPPELHLMAGARVGAAPWATTAYDDCRRLYLHGIICVVVSIQAGGGLSGFLQRGWDPPQEDGSGVVSGQRGDGRRSRSHADAPALDHARGVAELAAVGHARPRSAAVGCRRLRSGPRSPGGQGVRRRTVGPAVCQIGKWWALGVSTRLARFAVSSPEPAACRVRPPRSARLASDPPARRPSRPGRRWPCGPTPSPRAA
jgi:hypothetical protein